MHSYPQERNIPHQTNRHRRKRANADAEIEPLDWHARCPGLSAYAPEALLRRKQETMIAVSAPIDADTLRIRHEFLAMPGMRLAVPQAARLLGVSLHHAAEMLDLLEAEGFLIHTPDGQYRRAQPLMA
jgi:hypothetical protein